MKNLLRLIALAGIMAFITPAITYHKTVTCAPAKYYFRATITSVKSGVWSDPATWGGIVPVAADAVTILPGHVVALTDSVKINGLNLQGSLAYLQGENIELQSTANIIVTGVLQILNPDPAIKQGIRFTGINENNFTGGGMDVLASDVGLWVMGSGQQFIKGAEKTSWTRATGGVSVNATSFTVQSATGWRVGDEIAIVPTAENDYIGFEDRVITGISGNTITLNQPLTRAHPVVNNKWTAEVMNLSRNVYIEGTANGRSHIFIRSSKLQMIENVGLRYLGPRKQQGGDAATEAVLGRYGLHFHHSMEGSRGSIVRGCAARDIGNHVYVPHVSHGIRLLDNIAYNILGSGFWWDEGFPESSHDIGVHRMIVAKCDYVRRSINVFGGQGDPTLSSRAYMLNHGDDDTIMNCVAVGAYGDPHDGGGYKWESVNNDHLEGVWHFRGNMGHNIDAAAGLTWQNVQMPHQIFSFTGYHSREGWFQGAYGNPYGFDSMHLYKALLRVHAGSNTSGIRFENSTFSDVIIEGSPLPGSRPILFRNCTFDKLTDQVTSPTHNVDVIQCTGTVVHAGGSSEIIRIQPSQGQPTRKAGSSTTNIPTFAPAVWSNGKGLKATYYSSPMFTNAVVTRTDNVISFSEWGNGVHHKINNNLFSLVEQGYFQAQFNELYTISASGPGTIEMFINNVRYGNSATLQLEAGKWYSILVRYSKSNNQRGGLELKWRSASIDKFCPGGEHIPRCQLNDVPMVGLPIRDPISFTPPTPIKEFSIYPTLNPGLFFIESPKGKYKYTITNTLGQLIEQGQLNGNSKVVMDITGKAAGTYIVKIVGEKIAPVIKKIVKY